MSRLTLVVAVLLALLVVPAVAQDRYVVHFEGPTPFGPFHNKMRVAYSSHNAAVPSVVIEAEGGEGNVFQAWNLANQALTAEFATANHAIDTSWVSFLFTVPLAWSPMRKVFVADLPEPLGPKAFTAPSWPTRPSKIRAQIGWTEDGRMAVRDTATGAIGYEYP